MEKETVNFLKNIASIVRANYKTIQQKQDLNFDEMGMDILGSNFLYLYQASLDGGLFEDEGFNINITPPDALDMMSRREIVLAAGTCATAVKYYKDNPDEVDPDIHAMLQLSRAFLYLYQYWFKKIDIKLTIN